MIIGVSIVDKHKPAGHRHVGTYIFEIDYDPNSHFDFMTVACLPENEATLKPYLNKLLRQDQLPNPVNGVGES